MKLTNNDIFAVSSAINEIDSNDKIIVNFKTAFRLAVIVEELSSYISVFENSKNEIVKEVFGDDFEKMTNDDELAKHPKYNDLVQKINELSLEEVELKTQELTNEMIESIEGPASMSIIFGLKKLIKTED